MTNFTYRVIYKKLDQIRFTSILNLQRIMDRLFRRCDIPLAFSNGFHPQPRIRFFCPLALGFTGLHEVLDVTIINWLDPLNLLHELENHTIPGLSFENVVFWEHPNKPAKFIPFAAKYLVNPFSGSYSFREIEGAINGFIAKTSLLKERRGKVYELRSLVFRIEVDDPGVMMFLSAKANATGRPDEVMEALGFDPFLFSYSRVDFLDEEMNSMP